jgi:hypothetical protein
MIADPWIGFISQMVPEYEDLKYMAENGPKVKADLRKVNLSWRVRINEDWNNTPADQHDLYYTTDYGNLDRRCDWAAEQLSTWKYVTRLSHQEWKFKRSIDAEKFITLFNLKWASQ